MPMTFTVNLSTPGGYGNRQPYRQSEGDNFRNIRKALLPSSLGGDRYVSHGQTITASGTEALYLMKNYIQGPYKVLDYVSGTAI